MDTDFTELLLPRSKTTKPSTLTANNWRMLPAYLVNAYNDPAVSDIVVCVSGQKFHLHKVILMQSDVFAAMFKQYWAESTKQEVVLEESPMCVPYMDEFFQYMYGAEIVISCRNVIGLASLANKYQVEDLEAKCIESFRNCLLQVNMTHVPDVWHLTGAFNLQVLSDICASFLALNMSALIMDGFTTCPFTKEELMILANHPDLVIHEGDEYILRMFQWAYWISVLPKHSSENSKDTPEKESLNSSGHGEKAEPMSDCIIDLPKPSSEDNTVTQEMESLDTSGHSDKVELMSDDKSDDPEDFLISIVEALDFKILRTGELREVDALFADIELKCSTKLAMEKAKTDAYQYNLYNFEERESYKIRSPLALRIQHELHATKEPLRLHKRYEGSYGVFIVEVNVQSFNLEKQLTVRVSTSKADEGRRQTWHVTLVKQKDKPVYLRATLNSNLTKQRFIRMSALNVNQRTGSASAIAHADMLVDERASLKMKLGSQFLGSGSTFRQRSGEESQPCYYLWVFIRNFAPHDVINKKLIQSDQYADIL